MQDQDQSDNLIISLMSGYKEFRSIEIFIKSTLNTGNRIHILYDNIDASAIQYFLGKYPERLEFIPYGSYFDKHNVNRSLTPFNLKYVILYLYIKNYLTEQFKYILFCDVNDVYFQSDPFAEDIFSDINIFGERLKIGQCITNAMWCVQSYGYKQLAADYDKPVINTGVMIIKQSVILDFLKDFLEELTSLLSRTKLDIADQVGFTYHYNNKLANNKKVKLHKFEDNFCVHLAQDMYMGDLYNNLKATTKGLEYKNILPPVIHQYTRDPSLLLHVSKILGVN